MAKGKVKEEVEKYEKKAEDHKDHEHDHKKEKPKRSANAWAKFTGQRFRELRAKDPTVQFRDILKDPATKQAYMASKNK